MRIRILLCLLILAVCDIDQKYEYDDLVYSLNNIEKDKLFFLKFKSVFNKTYTNFDDMYWASYRLNRLKEFTRIFNKSGRSYQIGITQFSDEKLEVLKEKYLDMEMNKNINLKFLSDIHEEEADKNYNPIDWRNENIFLPVRDQLECGSCWAFATVGTIEALRAKKFNIKNYLSPQQLVDCDTKEKACKGGWPAIALNYAAANGLVSDNSYPYNGKNNVCLSEIVGSSTESKIERQFSRCEDEECTKQDFQYNLLKNGPVTVVIDAYNTKFFNYKSGIYDEECGEPNHAVILVGFGVDSTTGTKYWIIRNSWGKYWGMDGYGYVKYDPKNIYSCNLNRYGFQPTVLN